MRPMTPTEAPFRRWTLRLFYAYLALGALVVVALLLSITPANAGYPALFFMTLFVAVSVPVWALVAALAGVSLVRREPGSGPVWEILVACAIGLIALGPTAVGVVRALLRT